MGARFVSAILLLSLLSSGASAEDFETLSVANDFGRAIRIEVPRTAILPAEVAVLVNDSDPQSVEVGAYFAMKHGIPPENVIHVSFPPGNDSMSETDFRTLADRIDAAAGDRIEAFAVTWSRPWRVGAGMGMTSALALGYDARYVAATICNMTAIVPYHASASTRPYEDFGMRPAMVVGGADARSARAVIDRGALAQQTMPAGEGFFIRTSDALRSVRYRDFQATARAWNRPGALHLTYLDNSGGGLDYLRDSSNVLFYLTGLSRVPAIDTNRYVPGALADHLTSAGGILFGGSQMSALAWLAAGATASYGTVKEPCNYTAKFPEASVLVKTYFQGGTALEAYWKSVSAPGEGIFVGDPLARPFGTRAAFVNGVLEITTTILQPGAHYRLLAADSADGPFFELQSGISLTAPGYRTIREISGPYALYRLTSGDTPTVQPAATPPPVMLRPPAPPPPATSPPPVTPPPPPVAAPRPAAVPPPVTRPRDAVAPSVAILSLTPRTSHRRGGQTVRTRASDNVGVVLVELYADGRLIGSSRSSPFSIGFDSRLLQGGRHSLVAWAYDAAANVGLSVPLALDKPRGDRRGRRR